MARPSSLKPYSVKGDQTGDTAEPNTGPCVRICCPVTWGRASLSQVTADRPGAAAPLVRGVRRAPGPANAPLTLVALETTQVPPGGHMLWLQFHNTLVNVGRAPWPKPWAAANASQLLLALGSRTGAPGCAPAPSTAALGQHGCTVASSQQFLSRAQLFPELTVLGLEAFLGPEPCAARAWKRHTDSTHTHTHTSKGVAWEWHWDGLTLHPATAGGLITHTCSSCPIGTATELEPQW